MGKRDRLISQHPVLSMPLIDFFYLIDPSDNHRYVEFMSKIFFSKRNGKTNEEIVSMVTKLLFPGMQEDLLARYHEHYVNNRIENPDISKYESYKDMLAEIIKADEIVKLSELSKDVDKIFQDEEWLIILPHTHESMSLYGKSTKWCVTNKQSWDAYRSTRRILVAINRKTNTKFAIEVAYDSNNGLVSDVTGWNQNDHSMNVFAIGLSPAAIMEVTKFTSINLFEHWAKRAEKGYIGRFRGSDLTINKITENNFLNFISLSGPYLSKELKKQLTEDFERGISEKSKTKGRPIQSHSPKCMVEEETFPF